MDGVDGIGSYRGFFDILWNAREPAGGKNRSRYDTSSHLEEPFVQYSAGKPVLSSAGRLPGENPDASSEPVSSKERSPCGHERVRWMKAPPGIYRR